MNYILVGAIFVQAVGIAAFIGATRKADKKMINNMMIMKDATQSIRVATEVLIQESAKTINDAKDDTIKEFKTELDKQIWKSAFFTRR